MTWYYDIADGGGSMDVYDHTGSLAKTVENDGGGFSIPHDVLDIMFDAAVVAYNDAGGSVDDYALMCLADAAFEQIEPGTPA